MLRLYRVAGAAKYQRELYGGEKQRRDEAEPRLFKISKRSPRWGSPHPNECHRSDVTAINKKNDQNNEMIVQCGYVAIIHRCRAWYYAAILRRATGARERTRSKCGSVFSRSRIMHGRPSLRSTCRRFPWKQDVGAYGIDAIVVPPSRGERNAARDWSQAGFCLQAALAPFLL